MNKKRDKSIRLSSSISPRRYKILLRPDLDNFTFYGEETISLRVDKPTKKITLHSIDIEIDSVEIIDKEGKARAGRVEYDEKSETVTFIFLHSTPRGESNLKIYFRGIINDKMRGFYRSRYTIDGAERFLASTQFEATDARRAFPCFDEPSHKSVFDVTLMVPSHLTAISNTIPTVVSEHESGYKIVEFASTPPMSTYLLAFIVGDFESIEAKTKEGVLVRVFTTPGKKKQANFALMVAREALSFYSDYFKIPYPLPVLDLIAIPDFAYGAMENWGAVTYRESTLLVDEDLSSSANKQWVALVIAHELAHQWFGNLVTMEWWTHLWLNEGFASYIEYLAVDHIFPQWDIWTQFVSLEKGTALKLDGLKNTHPIEVAIHHPGEIEEIFDKVSYSKGASVIRMLANFLGEEKFRTGLRHYLKKHSHANTSTDDLWTSLEEVSRQPIRKIMKNWTGKAGYPLVRVRESKGTLKIDQERFFSSSVTRREVKDKTTWHIPFEIDYGLSKNTKHLMRSKTFTLTGSGHKRTWVNFNRGESSFIRVLYPQTYLGRLTNPIRDKVLPPVDRLGIIRDLFALSESGLVPISQVLSFALSYKNETDYTVWLEILSSLRQVANLIYFEDFYTLYEEHCRNLISGVAHKMTWNEKPGERHTNVLLRGLALYSLGSYGDSKTIKEAEKLFDRLIKKRNIDSELRSVVYNLTAENGDEKTHKVLTDMYKSETLQHEQDRIARALGLFKSKKLLKKTLEFSLSKDVRLQSVIPMITAVWTNPVGRDITWEFVKKNWGTLREKFTGGHLLARLIQSAGEFTDNKKAEEIELFFKKNPIPEASRSILQAVEQIRSNHSWLKRDSKSIKTFLAGIK